MLREEKVERISHENGGQGGKTGLEIHPYRLWQTSSTWGKPGRLSVGYSLLLRRCSTS